MRGLEQGAGARRGGGLSAALAWAWDLNFWGFTSGLNPFNHLGGLLHGKSFDVKLDLLFGP